MRCIKCGGQFIERHDEFKTVVGRGIGGIKVVGQLWYSCDTCDEALLSPGLCYNIDEQINLIKLNKGLVTKT
jgi:hypothetical protein